ncbi:membrane attack complex component perforin [Fusarium longipes]|uniref:Membrane attack complex component perforin n=1 Tax=Fusarium longipes TaxID=694270 RepID=A0A395S553_9HYPO|nr:membrane attack complex component perforin [Fusarium longipes]
MPLNFKPPISVPTVHSTDVPKATEEAVTTIVYFTDGLEQTEAFYLKLLKSSLDDETLSDLRSNIAGLTGSIEISHSPFCGRKGAVVPDSFSVQEYLTEYLSIKTEKAETLDLDMKGPSTSNKLNTTTNAASLLDVDKVAYLKSQVGDVAFKWITGTQAKYVPELEQRYWAAIRTGPSSTPPASTSTEAPPEDSKKTQDDPRGVPVGIERVRLPAFRLKKRTVWSDNIPTSTIDGVKLQLRIPDYIIDDKSYVSTYETEIEIQSSMATSLFSETDIAATGSVSHGGFSGSASMSFAMENSQAAASSKTKNSKKVTIAYNFPRVTIFLDNQSLELTTECADALYKVENKDDLHRFQDVYGEFFSTRVQLGGRLLATEDVTGTSAASSLEKQDQIAGLLDVVSQIKGMEWLTSKSQTWGLTINPNLDEVVAKPPATLARSSKTFTLNGSNYKDGRYLLAYPATACNLGDVAQVSNAAGNTSFNIDSDLINWGAILLGPAKAQSLESLRWFEAENMDGEIRYNTKYRVRNKERGLYIDYHWAQYHRLIAANAVRSTTYGIGFTNSDGSLETNVIPDKAKVHIVFYEYENDERLGYMYTRVENKDREYLFCSKTETAPGQEREMTITYQ